MSATDEKSRIRNRIHKSVVRISDPYKNVTIQKITLDATFTTHLGTVPS